MSLCLHSCNGKNRCSINVSNSVFGDPCSGTYKYLEVAYICECKYLKGPYMWCTICGGENGMIQTSVHTVLLLKQPLLQQKEFSCLNYVSEFNILFFHRSWGHSISASSALIINILEIHSYHNKHAFDLIHLSVCSLAKEMSNIAAESYSGYRNIPEY